MIAKTIYFQVLLYIFFGVIVGILIGGLITAVLVVVVEGGNLTFDYIVPLGSVILLVFVSGVTIVPRVAKLLKKDIMRIH